MGVVDGVHGMVISSSSNKNIHIMSFLPCRAECINRLGMGMGIVMEGVNEYFPIIPCEIPCCVMPPLTSGMIGKVLERGVINGGHRTKFTPSSLNVNVNGMPHLVWNSTYILS